MAEHISLNEIKRRLAEPVNINGDGFAILQALCSYVSTPDTEHRAHDVLLRALEHREAFGEAAVVLDGLVRQVGLFPYLEPDELGLADNIAFEFHRPLNMDEDGVVFHRVQAQVYTLLMNGDNVVLSAPTSFGKSLIIDAIVASGKYQNIAVVVPTIALIDETRRRLSRFSNQFKIITHNSQKRGDRNLFIMTQERILDQPNIEPLDFFVIDEFYKLQPRHEDSERSYLLNEAFYRLYKTDAQFYLLGPNIRGLDLSLAERLQFRFIKTDYKTVASDVRHVDAEDDDIDALVGLCSSLNEPTLIYCSSPARVRAVATALLELGRTEPALKSAVDWIGEEYDPDWLFAKALARGIGIHHGKLPRTLSQFVVRAFNDGLVRFLICTSTLIEGVNTKAKNVIIFDNKIARRKFDFFTYNNILGRSGRMFQHFVGHVYIFHAPPADELPFIDIPAFTQPDDAPDSLLMQLDEQDLRPAARERLAKLSRDGELDLETLRMGKGIDPAAQIELAHEIRSNLGRYWPLLNWTAFPTWGQLQSVCNLIWDFLVRDARMRAGVVSGNQLAFRVNQLRQQGGASSLIKAALLQRPPDKTADDVVEEAIDFLRSWANFHFPRYLMAVDRIQRAVFSKAGRRPGNFSFFAAQVENWFIDPAIMALDEYGIPIQVGQKLAALLRPDGDLDLVLGRLKQLKVNQLPLTDFERSLLEEALQYI
jgi:hypothetical protein